MQIANPIYDVVFKYLMEDGKIARQIVSSIIGQEVENIEFRPQEFSIDIDTAKKKQRSSKKKKSYLTFFSIYRLDFAATIKTTEGPKSIIIEIQKAKFATDIMRFRKYLGDQYANEENTFKRKVGKKTLKTGLPIINIYFLGHKLENMEGIPVIKVKRQYLDAASATVIEKKEAFIESLSHDSVIIQIPELKERRRNDLEILLSVFDQSNTSSDHHILNVKEEDFPEKFQTIIRRLQKAKEEPQIRKVMDVEDQIIEELADLEREIEEHVKSIEEKDKALVEHIKELVDKDKVLVEQDKALEEKDKALEEKDKALEQMRKELDELKKIIAA